MRETGYSRPYASPSAAAYSEPGGKHDDARWRLTVTGCLGSDPRGSDRSDWRRNAPAQPGPDVAEQLRQSDCDPIAGMAKLAQDDTVLPAVRARTFAELATYTAPRRKAVEISGQGGSPIEMKRYFDYSILPDDERHTLATLLQKARVGPAE